MKHLKRIDEAVGTINERRASAESLLKAVVNGDAKDVEGITLSKAMADAYLAWLQQSTYGKKFSALPFYKLFDASFNWGIERYIDSKLKGELKELKAQAKSMKEGKELNEGKMWSDIAKIMDKALKQADVPLSYARDYVKSLERMAKKNSKKFFDEYGNFSEDDFIEDVEYNMANESVTEAAPKMKKNVEAENIQELMNQIANAQKGGGSGRYGKEFDKAKTKALRAIKDMVMYSKIGI
jgi:hypothetical protein